MKTQLKLVETQALKALATESERPRLWEPNCGDWIGLVRRSLKMSQEDLAHRCGLTQPHLASIEKGKTDPRVSTLERIFDAMSCDMVIKPRPRKSLEEVLRGKARSVALKRLKQSAGTMALEDQAPDRDTFLALLEQRTDEILNRKSEHIWREENGRERHQKRNRR